MRASSNIGGVRQSLSLQTLCAILFFITALLQVIGADKAIRKSTYAGEGAVRNPNIDHQIDDSLGENDSQQPKGIIPPSSYQPPRKRQSSVVKDGTASSVDNALGTIDPKAPPSIVGHGKSDLSHDSGNKQPEIEEFRDPFSGVGKSLSDWEMEDIIIVVTIKGNIYGENRTTRQRLWHLQSQDLWNVKNHIKKSDDDERAFPEDDIEWVIEPGNGGTLYSYTPDGGLQKGPFHSIKYISENSPYQANGLSLSGRRETEIFTINPMTGDFLFSSAGPIHGGIPDKCLKKTKLEGLDDDEDSACTVRKVNFARTEYSINIAHLERGPLWTLEYTEWGIGAQNLPLARQHKSSMDGRYFHPAENGNLMCLQVGRDKPSFQMKYDEPVAQIFDVIRSSHDKSLVLLPHPKDPELVKSDAGNRWIDTIDNGSGMFALPLAREIVTKTPRLPDKSEWSEMDSDDRRSAIKGVRRVRGFRQNTIDAPSSDLNISHDNVPYSGDGLARTTSSPDEKPITDNSLLQTVALLILLTTVWYLGRHSTAISIATRRYLRQTFPSLHSGETRNILDIGPNTPMIKDTFNSEELQTQQSQEMVTVQVPTENTDPELQIVTQEELPPQLAKEVNIEASAEEFVVVPIPSGVETPKPKVRFTEDTAAPDGDGSGDEEQNEGDKSEAATPQKKKAKRQRGTRGGARRRGGKGGKKNGAEADDQKPGEGAEKNETDSKQPPSIESKPDGALIHSPESLEQDSNGQIGDDLFVSNEQLGSGSHGTLVYKGRFGNRDVAVKRLLVDFYDLASNEITLLQGVDDHPNVVRYYCQKQTSLFLYIALELCHASLQNVFDSPQHSELLSALDPQEVLRQMTLGVQHLHSLKIIHRDLKPQNILVSPMKKTRLGVKHPKVLISDFGLCKKLEADQSSFRATTAHAAGTSGWRAPELLQSENSMSSSLSDHTNHTNGSTSDSSVLDTSTNRRVNKAIDIFSLGCVFYFVLTRGTGHPFGERYMREANIIQGKYDLSGLAGLGDFGSEAKDLIESMIAHNHKLRPDATAVLTHPFFWSAEKKLNFLLDVSDRWEKEERDPPSPLLQLLESKAKNVFDKDWYKMLDKGLIDNLGKHRKYQGDRMLDLLRALRNKKHHYQDLPPAVQVTVGSLPDGYLHYFTSRFPNLLISMFHLVDDNVRHEAMWRSYFTPA